VIEARREAQESKDQAAVDWKRYQSDVAYRQEIDERYRQEREREAQYQESAIPAHQG
jgi:hypothetical protein